MLVKDTPNTYTNMNDVDQKTVELERKKYTLTKLAWAKLWLINIAIFFIIAFIFHAFGSFTPFRYAWIISIGIFFLSVMIVTNVKRAKPWSRFRWE